MVPLLLSLLGFSADIARAFFVNSQVSNAAREGALYAGHHYGDGTDAAPHNLATFEASVVNVVAGEESTPLIGCPTANRTVQFLNLDNSTFSDPGYPVAPGNGRELKIEVDCTLKPIVAWLPTPNPMHLSAQVTAYVYKVNP